MASISSSLTPRNITETKQSDTITVQGDGPAAVSAGGGNDSISARLGGVYFASGGAGTDGLIIRANVSATRLERGADGSVIILRSLSHRASSISV